MKKKIFVFGLVIVAFSLTSMALAASTEGIDDFATQSNRQGIKDERGNLSDKIKKDSAQINEQRTENREQNMEQRCAAVQNRIAERNSKFEENKSKHTAVYNNMTDRISKFITRLSGEDYDVSKIQADLTILKEKISKIEVNLAAQNSKLNETKEFACGHSEGDFKDKLTKTKTMMASIHQEAMDIRMFVQTTLRADIQSLRNQKIEEKKDINKSEDAL